jgi:hypothetical protein
MVIAMLAFLAGAAASAAMFMPVLLMRMKPVQVLIARKDIAQWSTIRDPDEMFTTVEKPADLLPRKCVPPEQLAELKHRRFREELKAGEVLTTDHLLVKDATGIEIGPREGKRFMFVAIGARADVIDSRNGNVALKNRPLVAIDVDGENATATLEVESGEQVITLAQLRDSRSISLLLHPLPDDKAKGQAPLEIPPPPPPPPPEEKK